MARDRPTGGDETNLLAGVALTILSLALFALAWLLFEAGKPGAPTFSDARADYGVEPGVRLYLPKSVGIKSVATDVYFRGISKDTKQDITITIVGDRSYQKTFTVVVEIREAARLVFDDLKKSLQDSYESDYTSVVSSTNGNQYLIVEEKPEQLGVWTLHLSGRMLISALNSENSRTSFVSPKYGNVRFCDFLAGVSTQESAGPVDVEKFRDEFLCDIEPKFPSSVAMQIEGYLTTATRLDYSEPEPSMGNGTALRWHTDDPGLGFRARANYADIGGEASAQRYLFVSGVVVGLASAGVPGAMRFLLSLFKKVWRLFKKVWRRPRRR